MNPMSMAGGSAEAPVCYSSCILGNGRPRLITRHLVDLLILSDELISMLEI